MTTGKQADGELLDDILLADDDDDLRAIYAAVLRADGFEVIEAIDGEQAIERAVADAPTLVLLDLWMPKVNGFEVLERLLMNPATSRTRVVILSNLADADSHLEGFASGVVDYWVKGLSLDELRNRVRRILAGSALVPEPF